MSSKKSGKKNPIYKRSIFYFVSVGVLAFLFGVAGMAMYVQSTKEGPPQSSKTKTVSGVNGMTSGVQITNFSAQGLLDDSNTQRANSSIGALSLNELLNASAQAKCDDMAKRNYWSHNTPEGTEPWTFVDAQGYKYAKLGENLATGYQNSAGVIAGWMASLPHKANLLDSKFENVGFGICFSENYTSAGGGQMIIIVQHLGKTKVATTNSAPATKKVKPYQPPVCTKTSIPYKTNYVEVSYLYVGETQEYGGTDGYVNSCTADSTGYKPADITLPPYDKTIYVGTKPRP